MEYKRYYTELKEKVISSYLSGENQYESLLGNIIVFCEYLLMLK